MADKKISQLTNISDPATSDITIIVDSVGTVDKKITLDSIPVSDPQQTALDARVLNSGDTLTGEYVISEEAAPNLTLQNQSPDGLTGIYLKNNDESIFATIAVIGSNNTNYSPEVNPGDLMVSGGSGAIYFGTETANFKIVQNNAIKASSINGFLTASSIDANKLAINSLTTKTTPEVGDLLPIYDLAGAANKKVTLDSLPLSTFISDRLQNTACSLFSSFTPSVVTGSTNETIARTITIPAGTLSSSDIINFKAMPFVKTGTGANYTIRIKTNTSNTLTGATTIATNVTALANVLWMSMVRKYVVNGGLLYGYPFTTTIITDLISAPPLWSSTSFNVNVDNYMFVTIQLVNATDSVSNLVLQVDKE
jgi:hypothetical protein